MSKFKAIIFDCDGVLMDSEALACQVSAQILTERGYAISTEQYIDRFMGLGFKNVLKIIKDETGIEITVTQEEKDGVRGPIFEEHLKATPGTLEAISQLSLPFCIASGSSQERLMHTLGIVGLDEYFKDRVFSAEQVSRPKPAPDVFLFAAQKLGIAPHDCLVIEDGHLGAQGAKEAGMKVYGFTGASHMNEERIQMLSNAGAEVLFSDMRELLLLIA